MPKKIPYIAAHKDLNGNLCIDIDGGDPCFILEWDEAEEFMRSIISALNDHRPEYQIWLKDGHG